MYAIDVGTNQLDWKLRNNIQIKSIENKHINDLEFIDIDNEKPDILVMDISFISIKSNNPENIFPATVISRNIVKAINIPLKSPFEDSFESLYFFTSIIYIFLNTHINNRINKIICGKF